LKNQTFEIIFEPLQLLLLVLFLLLLAYAFRLKTFYGAKVMDELQKMLPMPMDELTKWEKAELKADTVIYTFKIYEKDAKITKEQSKKVKDQLCANPTVKTLALAGFKVRSIYTGLDDKEVASVTVDTKACGFKK
jgi:hypothetical protein